MAAAARRGHEGLAELMAAATLRAGASAVFASARAPSQGALPALPLGADTNTLQLFRSLSAPRAEPFRFLLAAGAAAVRGDVRFCLFLGAVGDGSREAPAKEQRARLGSGGSGV